MYYVKDLDPVKVAKLDNTTLANLFYAADPIHAEIREADMPPHLHAMAFLTFKSCGMKDLRGFDGMRIGAMQLRRMRLTVERLRTYGNLTRS